MEPKKNLSAAGALAMALASGTALGRFTAPAPLPSKVSPIGIRWMGPTSDQKHPYYYGVPLKVEQGVTTAVREPICWTDGQPPTLDGKPYPEAATLCQKVVACGAAVQAALPGVSDSIARSNVPGDAGQ